MWARGAVWAAAVLLAATAAHAGGTLEAPPSLGGMRFGGSCSGGESGVQRLRGGFEAVMPLKPANLGTPNAWSGQNVGPKEKRMKFLHAKARPQPKVQSRWYIDCSRPVGDKLLDIADLERFLRENIKVQGRTGNLAAGKAAEHPRVTVFVEKDVRVILQSYIPVAKRYVKYLIKSFLYKRGLRDFVWCVAAGKASYRLKYYNIQDIKATAAAQVQGVTGEGDTGEGTDVGAHSGEDPDMGGDGVEEEGGGVVDVAAAE